MTSWHQMLKLGAAALILVGASAVEGDGTIGTRVTWDTFDTKKGDVSCWLRRLQAIVPGV